MRALAVLLLCLLPGLATAQADGLPAFHEVTGVAADDVLNVRAAPDAGAEKVGDLAPDTTGVEVMALRDGWGQVNAGERSGWVSMRFLSRTSPEGVTFSSRLRCSGTEPFWGLEIAQGTEATFTRPAGPDVTYSVGTLQAAEGRRDSFLLLGTGPHAWLTAVLRRAQCTDGMSDRAYGIAADIVLTGHSEPALYSGCCSLR